jgi:sugar phosphate isomerase/epimerase
MTESKDQSTKPPIGCSEWSLRRIPLQEQFQLLNEIGISSIEFGLGGNYPGHVSGTPTPEEVKEVQQLSQQHQIETSFCAIESDLTGSDSNQVSHELGRLKTKLSIAAQLEIQSVNLTISFCPTIEVDEKRLNHLTEAIQTIDIHAQENGFRIALTTRGLVEEQCEEGDFYIETIMTNRESLVRMADSLPSNIGFAYEPGMFKAVNPSDLRLGLDIIKERVDVCVLQDWKQHNRFLQQSIIGADDLNYATLLAHLPTNMPCLISVPPTTSPKINLERSLEYLKRISSQSQ